MKNVSPMIFVFTMFDLESEKKKGDCYQPPPVCKSHAHRGN